MLIVVGALVGMTTVDAYAKRRKASRSSSGKSITKLAQSIRELDVTEINSLNDCKQFKQQVEKLALPCFKASYDKKATTTEAKTRAVMNQVVKQVTPGLESGSTMDMVDAGIIHRAAHNYNAFAAQEEMLNSAPAGAKDAINNEIDAWLKLQKELLKYCVNASSLEFFGGSMAILGASGSAWNIAEMRDVDTQQLASMGFNASESAASMQDVSDKATSLVIKMAQNAQRLKESITDDDKKYFPELYDSASQGIDQAMQQVTILFPQWIKARQQLIKHAKQPASAIKSTQQVLNTIESLTSFNEEEAWAKK